MLSDITHSIVNIFNNVVVDFCLVTNITNYFKQSFNCVVVVEECAILLLVYAFFY